ncbi:MAG: hypothetical protein ACI4I2_02190 [Oscillospiraceae bacterium]
MSKQYEKEFKENAVQYRNYYPDLTVKNCAKNIGIPYDTLNSVTFYDEESRIAGGNTSPTSNLSK